MTTTTLISPVTVGGPVQRMPSADVYPYVTLADWGYGWVVIECHKSTGDAERWQTEYMRATPRCATVHRSDIRIAC